METYEIIRDMPLFSDLDQHALKRINELVQIKEYKTGEFIIKEGEEGIGCFIVTSGKVDIITGYNTELQNVIATLDQGEILGEISMIDAYPTTATVVAVENIECLFISAWDFRAQMQAYPEIALQLLPILAKRLRGLFERSRLVSAGKK